ncbi:MAG: V-type ATP synthase subunit D [Sedimentisphaerales bacterium]|nr:V-type ATP synthase subunit D [Sedimentisphaerales bacterium]
MKRYRDALSRYQRYLPMLKLKQQQLQMSMRQVNKERREAQAAMEAAQEQFEPYQVIMHDIGGVDVKGLAKPQEVKTSTTNIAGVNIPVFEEAIFAQCNYSLFATGVWVDSALMSLRDLNSRREKLTILDRQHALLQRELTKISQRVNLFEKVKIPEAREVIRVIRIKLGDEMAAAVGRAKIAKAKIAEASSCDAQELHPESLEKTA